MHTAVSCFIEGGFGLFLNGHNETLSAARTPQVWEVHRLPDHTVWLLLPETHRFITAEKFLGIAGDVTVRCQAPKDFEQWTLTWRADLSVSAHSTRPFFCVLHPCLTLHTLT